MRLKSQDIGGLIAIGVRRNFSDYFMKQVGESIVSGLTTQAEPARQYKISPVMIDQWKKYYKADKFFENINMTWQGMIKDKGA